MVGIHNLDENFMMINSALERIAAAIEDQRPRLDRHLEDPEYLKAFAKEEREVLLGEVEALEAQLETAMRFCEKFAKGLLTANETCELLKFLSDAQAQGDT